MIILSPTYFSFAASSLSTYYIHFWADQDVRTNPTNLARQKIRFDATASTISPANVLVKIIITTIVIIESTNVVGPSGGSLAAAAAAAHVRTC